jgi:hypothetical protein
MNRARHAEGKGIAVITVHGTNDGAAGDTGGKWWQKDSPFATALLAALRGSGQNADLIAFHWSGANSELARRRGAEALAQIIRRCRGAYASTHIVAHSHGGNVANVAADLRGWGRSRHGSGLASLVTVGTPFLRRRVGAMEYLSAVVFLVIALLSAPLWVNTVLTRFAETSSGHDGVFWATLVGGAGAIVASIVLTLQTALSGVRRVIQPNAHLRSRNAILSIRHPQDEAISFLQKIDTAQLEAIPKGALLRGSGNLAVAASTPVVNLVALAVLGAIAYFSIVGRTEQSENLAALFVLASCGLFCLLYAVGRILLGVIPEILLRRRLNDRIANALRGLALGSDGVQRLEAVSPVSHTLRTVEAPLDAGTVERMKANAADQAGKLIDKYRWALFTAGGDTGRSLRELSEDALTWDSLIHTTYFEQPEVIETIANHIAEQASASHGPSRVRRPRRAPVTA